MKESLWGYVVVVMGMIAITVIFVFQTLTNTDQQLMVLLDESTKGAMYDAFDYASYRASGTIRIDREKFVENFLRRFSQNASISSTYRVKIYDVNELPPKVSIKVSTQEEGSVFSFGDTETIKYTLSNTIDAILETTYYASSY